MPPGVLAHLYRMRWDIEKTFDLFKNKFGEKKAWACSATAKQQQAAFLSLAHNLILLLEHSLATQQDVRNRAEEVRRAKRLEKLKFAARKANVVVPLAVELTQRCNADQREVYPLGSCAPLENRLATTRLCGPRSPLRTPLKPSSLDTVDERTRITGISRKWHGGHQTRCPIAFSFASPSLQATSCGRRFDKAASAAVTPAASPIATALPVTR